MCRLIFMVVLIVFFISFFSGASVAGRQDDIANSGQHNIISFDEMEREYKINKGLAKLEELELARGKIRNTEKLQASMLERDIEALAHRTSTFNLQFWLTIVITIVVLLLVSGGFVLSWKQFHRDERLGITPDPTQMEISLKGVKIGSSVIGLVVLSISLGFFFLYIKYVFMITEVGAQAISQ